MTNELLKTIATLHCVQNDLLLQSHAEVVTSLVTVNVTSH